MNPYETLGVDKHCSRKEIDKAYRRLSMMHHPDKGGDPEKFSEVAIAAQILRDPHRRKLYDDYGLIFDISENLIQEGIKNKIKIYIRGWLDSELRLGRQISIKLYLSNEINKELCAMEEYKKKLNEFIKTLNTRKKYVYVSDGENLVLNIIDEKIMSFKNEIAELERDRYVLTKTMEISRKYSSNEIMNKVDTIVTSNAEDCFTYTFYTR